MTGRRRGRGELRPGTSGSLSRSVALCAPGKGSGGTQLVEIEVGLNSPATGEKLGAMRLPEDCTVVSVQRGRKIIIPHGDTVVEPGDKVIAFATEGCAPTLRAIFEPLEEETALPRRN